MIKEFKFKKSRIFTAIILFLLLTAIITISFLIFPEGLAKHCYTKTEYIQLIGLFPFVFSSTMTYSLVKVYFRTKAIVITDEYLIDYSKYESIGKIKWRDITKIQRLKKKSIEVFLKRDLYKTKKRNLLKRFLTFMNNWNHKKSIIISSALTDGSIEDLFKEITSAYRTYK